jgi:chaperone modulatory protein CbpM
MATVALVRRENGRVDTLALAAGLHPDLVARFIRLGLVDPAAAGAAARLAQAARLRRDLGVSYSGAVLACQLLARIDELEARLRRYER